MKARPRVVSAPLRSPRPIARETSPRRDRDGLPLPHERDESTGQTAGEPDPRMRQAYEDITAGLVDTDLRATPGLDARRRRALLRRRG
jgi:hypothetical protein